MDAEKVGSRTGRMQERMDAEKVGCRTGGMQERRAAKFGSKLARISALFGRATAIEPFYLVPPRRAPPFFTLRKWQSDQHR